MTDASIQMNTLFVLLLVLPAIQVMVSCHRVCFVGLEYNPQSGIPPRWFLPYDPCECAAIHLGGMRVLDSLHHQGAPYYQDKLYLSDDADNVQDYFGCRQPTTVHTLCSSVGPIGLSERELISDDQLKASSHEDCCPAAEGRLYGGKAWQTTSTNDLWIEVDLVESTVVTGVITQGYSSWYVKTYRVSYYAPSSSARDYAVDENEQTEVFRGNKNDESAVTNLFDAEVVATLVRIEPVTWSGGVAMRLELLGCRFESGGWLGI